MCQAQAVTAGYAHPARNDCIAADRTLQVHLLADLDRHTFLLLHDDAQAGWVRDLPANVQPVRVGGSLAGWWRRIAWQISALPRLLRQLDAELVLTTSGAALPRCPLPQVSYAQNPWCLVPGVPRGIVQKQRAALQRRAYRRAMRKADLVLYISRHLRDLYRNGTAKTENRPGRIVSRRS